MHSPSIAEGIIDYAKRNDMDLIVVGTKGLTEFEKFLIGSVASNVIAHAHGPVWPLDDDSRTLCDRLMCRLRILC